LMKRGTEPKWNKQNGNYVPNQRCTSSQ